MTMEKLKHSPEHVALMSFLDTLGELINLCNRVIWIAKLNNEYAEKAKKIIEPMVLSGGEITPEFYEIKKKIEKQIAILDKLVEAYEGIHTTE